MEFFIPSLLLFLVSIVVSFIIAPRFTPLVIALLSIALLTFGVYDHYKMFASEYRLSTWQDGLKIYAPAIMIGAIILFIIYSILAFFTSGSVPVPPIPNIATPEPLPSTNQVNTALNKTISGLTNVTNNIINKVNNTVNKVNNNKGNVLTDIVGNVTNAAGNLGNTLANATGINTNGKKGNNNLSRSFLETI